MGGLRWRAGWCFRSFRRQKAQNHHSRAFLAWKEESCEWRVGVVFSEFSRPESSKSPLPRVSGLEGGGLRVACGSCVFSEFSRPESSKSPLPRVSGLEGGGLRVACGSGVFGAPARLWPGRGRHAGGVREWCFRSFRSQKAQNHHSRASLAWKGEACGWRARVVFLEFSRPESLKSPLPRVFGLEGGGLRVACGSFVFGVFTARKPKIITPARLWPGRGRLAGGVREWCFGVITTPARFWPGRGRLAGGVREWCFRSFRGQKAQNQQSRAFLAWKGQACGWRAGVVFSEFSRPESSKSPLPRGSGLEGGGLRVKAQNHHSRASLAWKGKACGWRAGVVFSELSRPESSKSPLPRVSGLKGGGMRVACGSGVFGVFAARKLKITTFARLWPGRGRLAGGVREFSQNHNSRASLAWKGQACGWRAGVVFSEFSRPESSKSPLPRVFGLEGEGLRVACGSGVFGVFAARKLKITTPARLWPGRRSLAGGVREWCFRSFHGQKAQNHHSCASLAWKRGGLRVACGKCVSGVFATRKLKITTDARFCPGRGRLAGGVREWCFRSFHGQKTQNHLSRAWLGRERLAGGVRERSLAWKGEACG